METTRIALFKGREIRKIIYQNEWWFSVVDVVQALTDQASDNAARKYWNKLAQRLRDEGSELVTFCHQLKLEAPDGKMRKTDCANTGGIFRIIQSIPSPKAEPLDSRGVSKLKFDAKSGGEIAGNARRQLEKRIGRPIVSKGNYLKRPEKDRRLLK